MDTHFWVFIFGDLEGFFFFEDVKRQNIYQINKNKTELNQTQNKVQVQVQVGSQFCA